MIKKKIEECEEQLKQAMLESDILTLDKLLAPDLVFTNHLGQLMTKRDDLDAHKSGMLKINKITLSEQMIKIFSGSAVVTVQAHILGVFDNKVSDSNFRFTRVWSKESNDVWQIVAGHSSIIV